MFCSLNDDARPGDINFSLRQDRGEVEVRLFSRSLVHRWLFTFKRFTETR